MNNDKSQLDRFKEAARQLETDDDEERFEKRLRKIVKQRSVAKGGVNRGDGSGDAQSGGGDE